VSPSADGRQTAEQYDAMAQTYAPSNAINVANALYERPATKAMLGAVGGRRVLEIGCGSGELTSWLLDEGAQVTAFDVSEQMLAIARQKLGERAKLFRADLHDGLGFCEDESVDIVIASLVLHYLEDWEPVLAEVWRVLVPGGAFVFSTHHPTWDGHNHSPEDYFAKMQVTESWYPPFEVTFWRRPLRDMTRPIARAGFVIEALDEPEPLGEVEQADRQAWKELNRSPFLLVFRLRKEL
jgi:ubiquinone/menaquinone biosynthesis C-methylase UbiE